MKEVREPLLRLSSLHAGYGESLVLSGVSLEVGENEVVCLLGPNGAGKTTTLMTITGLLAPSQGSVCFKGQPLEQVPAHERVELGIALSPEGRQVFPALSVEENLLLGSFTPRSRAGRARNLERVQALFPRLADRRRQLAGLMSGGEQQMLAIGRALMSEPRLLLLDEPSLGLAPLVISTVYEAISRIAAEGVSILLVEQNTEVAFDVAHRGYVLSHGQVVASGLSESFRGQSILQEAFFGQEARGAA